MNDPAPGIHILRVRADRELLRAMVGEFFDEMAKYVVDVERGVIALGGELHADAEQVLLSDGSRQKDLWGANYLPGRGRNGCIEFTSLINIRPAQGNKSMEVNDPTLRARIRDLTFSLIGEGEQI